MKAHGISDDYGTPSGTGWVMLTWCSCGQRFTGKGRTERKAKRAADGKYQDHKGFAFAAGPAWRELAA